MTSDPGDMRSTGWRWIAGIWSAYALCDACQTVLSMRVDGKHQPWLPGFTTDFASWLPWALATPLVIAAARRYPLLRGLSLRSVCTHFALFAVVSAVAESWSAELQVLFNPWGNAQPPTFVATWTMMCLYQVVTFITAYALIVTVTFVVDANARMTRQMTEAARLNEELSKAQLAALRRQIDPHFLYNTLNSVAALVRDHLNDAAVRMIVGLSEFLRRSSEDSHRSQVALQEEVEYLQRYLEIQKVRFGERLQVSVDIPADLLRAQVPNLLLQPLVENAIKHGIAKRVAGGAVRVAGACHDSRLCLSVYNDGPALPTDWEAGQTGVGIRNLRTRLQILHGNESELQLTRANSAGVEVLVTLPFREA
ncbi:MAG TPA: histidine kinase [Steroidobacteraceae bacterium]|jgi:two-component sensor histidine kinase|nr:histidine kinase [Steroidobacteraceae bacterium]